MVELGQNDAEEKNTNCLQLNKNIYGMFYAALIFYKAYSAQLMKQMGMERSQSDACLFVKWDTDGEVTLVTSCHVDDTLVAETQESIAEFKTQLKERFKLKEMGIMTKHLRIKYEWCKDKQGEPYVVATMDDLIQEIIKTTETHYGHELST